MKWFQTENNLITNSSPALRLREVKFDDKIGWGRAWFNQHDDEKKRYVGDVMENYEKKNFDTFKINIKSLQKKKLIKNATCSGINFKLS